MPVGLAVQRGHFTAGARLTYRVTSHSSFMVAFGVVCMDPCVAPSSRGSRPPARLYLQLYSIHCYALLMRLWIQLLWQQNEALLPRLLIAKSDAHVMLMPCRSRPTWPRVPRFQRTRGLRPVTGCWLLHDMHRTWHCHFSQRHWGPYR